MRLVTVIECLFRVSAAHVDVTPEAELKLAAGLVSEFHPEQPSPRLILRLFMNRPLDLLAEARKIVKRRA